MLITSDVPGRNAGANFYVIGVESSPYTAKMRAWFRYRQIPYIWKCRYPQLDPEFAVMQPRLMPVVRYPDGSTRDDSSRIILDLEEMWPGYRSVRPDDAALDLYSLIIEDMADELFTKIVYKSRFEGEVDRNFASQWVMDDSYPALSIPELQEKAKAFLERQDNRRELVGINAASNSMLDRVFERLIGSLKPLVARDVFLFGSRPSLGDFGLFAQLHTLCSDPTPSAIIRAHSPRIEFWVRRMHDLSGVDGAWQASNAPTETVIELLSIAGDIYLPMLDANSDATRSRTPTYEALIDGETLTQLTFKYHDKCYAALRQAFASLSRVDKDRAANVLENTGCLRFLTK